MDTYYNSKLPLCSQLSIFFHVNSLQPTTITTSTANLFSADDYRDLRQNNKNENKP